MGTPAVCPHNNPPITTNGPYYRQVHPNNFQNGRALPGSFILNNTGCHYGLSLHDGARTTADLCHQEYTQDGNRRSATVLEISDQELTHSGVFVVVDSPDAITYVHVDALYKHALSNRQRKNADRELLVAANKRGLVYFPEL